MQFPNLFDISEMFEIRWVRIAAASVLALFLLAFAGVLVVKYKESSTAGCECEGLVDHASLQLYNPFRDRTPERLGQSAMLAIQAHQCQRFPGPPIFCEEENHLTILSWKLTGVAEDDNQTSAVVRFWVVRSAKLGEPFEDPLLMTLQRTRGSWTIERVDTYY